MAEKDELLQVLENLVEVLKKNNFLPQNTDKKSLVEEVYKNVKSSGYDKDDLEYRRADTIKALSIACIAQSSPTNKFDYKLLFKPRDGETEDTLKKELNNIFKEMLILKMGKGKKLTPEQEEKLEEQINKIFDKHFGKTEENSKIYENQQLTATLASVVDYEAETNRMFYGVGNPGEAPIPIFQQIGNLIGAVDRNSNLSQPNFMSQEDNPYSPDPNGFKISGFFQSLANDNPVDTLAETLLVEKNLNTPKLKMGKDPGAF